MPPLPLQPTVLCILDGWGMAPASTRNGISQARTPNYDAFRKNYPHSQLEASEVSVGLPAGQMGNSEVGHMTIGAGRVMMQDLPRIHAGLEEGRLEALPPLEKFVKDLKASGGACHLMGLLSPGGVHSHQSHLEKLVIFFKKQGIPVHVHAFLDGRDTPPQSALAYLKDFWAHTHTHLSTLGGRYYAMDRDQRWDRVEKAWRTMALGEGPVMEEAFPILQNYYTQGIGDEFIPPHCRAGYPGMKDGDGLFMVNFRADRARQILNAFLLPHFDGFVRMRVPTFAATLGMGEYSAELTPYMPALFPKDTVTACLGSVVSKAGLKQLRIAETEKYAHVTFFLNGGEEKVFPGEERILISSPAVATYDLQPEMSAQELTDRLVKAIKSHEYSLIVANYANADMVGHTGLPEAIAKAVETVDHCLGRLEQAVREARYALIITADHGNAEQMADEMTGGVHTAHTCNPVPFILINGPAGARQAQNGQLSDLAPTVLTLLGLPIPPEMTGKALINQ